MKALLAVLVVALAPAHIRFAVLGIPVSIPAAWLILAAEVLTRGRDRVAGRAGDPPVPVRALAAAQRGDVVTAAAALGSRQAAVLEQPAPSTRA